MNSIEVKNLTKKFGKFISVNNISFEVGQGEVFGFLGANGAGKSTTIKMLCGILSSTSGDALVGGYSINKEPEKVKRQIGYMSQKFSLYNDLTVEENIDFFGGVYGLENDNLKRRKEWVLEIANLKELVNVKSRKLEQTELELKKIKKEMSAIKLIQDKIMAPPKVETVKQAKKVAPKKSVRKEKLK